MDFRLISMDFQTVIDFHRFPYIFFDLHGLVQINKVEACFFCIHFIQEKIIRVLLGLQGGSE